MGLTTLEESLSGAFEFPPSPMGSVPQDVGTEFSIVVKAYSEAEVGAHSSVANLKALLT